MDTFTAIDFELATSEYTSVCSIGIVNVLAGEIVNEFYSLIQPPNNKYMWQTTRVHGIKAKDTIEAPTFAQIFDVISPLLMNQKMVAHNEGFDRSVLQKTMQMIGLQYKTLHLPEKWECTSDIYRQRGFVKTKLSVCCDLMGIELDHHDALSDARGSALLYLKRNEVPKTMID